MQIDLFSGQNNLVARDYDALGQQGPDSNTYTVTLNDAQFLQFGTPISLSSNYAENGASPGSPINWPIELNGGVGPYAISVDWGDGSPQELQSIANDGTVNITHTYRDAGVYTVVAKAVDKNGETAFLQLVGQATGAIQNNEKSSGASVIIQKNGSTPLWLFFIMIPLIFVAFWLGRKYEYQILRSQYLNLDK